MGHFMDGRVIQGQNFRRLEERKFRKCARLEPAFDVDFFAKPCGRGTPCDTCRKVLSPRVWKSGCVRTKLHEQLDLYSAGVQVVLSQNRINMLKSQLHLTSNGTVVEATHFQGSGHVICLKTLVAMFHCEPSPGDEEKQQKEAVPQAIMAGPEQDDEHPERKGAIPQVIMVDPDQDDVMDKVEGYMRQVLPTLIEKEPSPFMRKTLDAAVQRVAETNDELLQKALELWGLVEIIDRERQWIIIEKPKEKVKEPKIIKEGENENHFDTYTMFCMQLNAAAERKANTTSKGLLNGMHRVLQDSKTKVGFPVFLSCLLFLICVEKSTWAFKAWEQDHLRPAWPLQREPGSFVHQGCTLADLLKMLLSIRKALPRLGKGYNGKLVAEEGAEARAFFQALDLNCKSLVSPRFKLLILTQCSSQMMTLYRDATERTFRPRNPGPWSSCSAHA